ncbi:MAG: aspartate--tRNA ligase [Acholeplasmataceae bacterium]
MTYTHTNNELTLKDLGQKVRLKGWVAKTRDLGGLFFIDLRDRFGITQLVMKPDESVRSIRNEFVIEVEGVVIERESKNHRMVTGEIEVEVSALRVLSKSLTPPLYITDQTDALEETRLKYRYLDLRRPVMQNYLIKRHEITQSIRSVLVEQGYYELETPILGKSTPEGARDYLVPSRLYPGTFYALPQSPQIYKQLFMIAGFEKYFQIARCFRDEDLRADRQPEFTQVDIEASFVDENDVMDLTERIMQKTLKDVAGITVERPFPRITYDEAMSIYGTDKPDIRYGLHLTDYSEFFRNIGVPLFDSCETIKGIRVADASSLSRKVIDQLTDLVKKNHGKALAHLRRRNGQYSGSIRKFLDDEQLAALDIDEGAMILFVPGSFADVSKSLGALRVRLARLLDLIPEHEHAFIWVTDWPLLEYDETDARFYAKHHPFTAPTDPEQLENEPHLARARAYDIVLNGHEIGGGSMRIHDMDLQNAMFRTLGLKEEEVKDRFGFFVEALRYGTPPHGGIALGLDRIVMILTRTDNIKDVIAFPKTQSAKDIMMEAPSSVDRTQLAELKLKVGE